jgi:hypothetical protein
MFLLSLQEYAISLMKEGALIKDVYKQLLQKVKEEKPELEKHFVKTAGFTVCARSHSHKPGRQLTTRVLSDRYRVPRVFLRYRSQVRQATAQRHGLQSLTWFPRYCRP